MVYQGQALNGLLISLEAKFIHRIEKPSRGSMSIDLIGEQNRMDYLIYSKARVVKFIGQYVASTLI